MSTVLVRDAPGTGRSFCSVAAVPKIHAPKCNLSTAAVFEAGSRMMIYAREQPKSWDFIAASPTAQHQKASFELHAPIRCRINLFIHVHRLRTSGRLLLRCPQSGAVRLFRCFHWPAEPRIFMPAGICSLSSTGSALMHEGDPSVSFRS